jgi:cytochrome c553
MDRRQWYRWVFALPAAALWIISAAAATQPRAGAPAIVTRACSGCHGIGGNSQLPYVPRLAGQSAAYLERKIESFRSTGALPVDEALARAAHAGRPGKGAGVTSDAAVHMVGVARGIRAEEMKAAIQWYAAQSPARGRGGNPKLVEEGRDLFANGRPSQGLAACQTCHGAQAQGTDAAPRLAGQHAPYLIGQINLFRTGANHNSPQMTGVARQLEASQARAIGAYLQSR